MPKQILSLSGGKDSTAMLLKLIEDNVRDGKNIPIDEVVFFDTGMEFKAVYDNINYYWT